jgi:F-type H+-transporting ATPase subunit delta
MRNIRVAKRYARSLFDAAQMHQCLDAIRADVELFRVTFMQSGPLRAFLRNPVIAAERKVTILRELFSTRTHQLFTAFVELVCMKGRENLLDQIADQFIVLYNENAGIIPAHVTTAVELSAHLVPRVEEFIARRFGGKPELTFSVNPAILGGIVITCGDIRLDASLVGQIQRLRNTLLHATRLHNLSTDGAGSRHAQ